MCNGLTDWLVLPYKGARKQGVAGFLKGFFKGVANIVFKPAAGKEQSISNLTSDITPANPTRWCWIRVSPVLWYIQRGE